MNHDNAPSDTVAEVQQCELAYNRLRDELAKVIVGQDEAIEQSLVAIFAQGHALLEGVPGLAKTLLVSSLARTLQLSFKRLQFTPDIMPSDVTGTDIIQEDPATGRRETKFLPGPLFANMILADEINRTPPKTQSAMLEAMQEHQISSGGKTYPLPDPFFVLATQNPLEQEGTYPLPEAQLDRFLLYIRMDYPREAEEWEIARRGTMEAVQPLAAVISADEVLRFRDLARRVPVSDQVLGYAWTLVRASRPGSRQAFDFINRYVRFGAGPRGLLSLLWSAQARALLYGRYHATLADVKALLKPALRHRVACNYAAQAAGISTDQLLDQLLAAVPDDRLYEKPLT